MPNSRALVLGGSLAGMCAARALRRSFDEVIVLERDALPGGAEERPGVPQARHVHALLARGWIELERLFPGFQARMRAGGVHELDFGSDFAALRIVAWQDPVPCGLGLYLASRDLTESTVRALFREARVAEVRERVTVTGLVTAGGRVTGV